jgi:hypothetical protein
VNVESEGELQGFQETKQLAIGNGIRNNAVIVGVANALK